MTAYVPPLARGDRSLVGNWFWQVDKPILMAVLALILTGVALSFASSPAAALRDDSISGDFYYAWRMIAFATLGLGILISTSMLSPRHVRRVSALTFLFCIGVMCLLPFIGNEAKGATRWLAIGPFGFQPSEFVKPVLIVLAAWMFAEGQKGEGVPGMSLAFGLYGITAGLLIIQPDIGQTVLITTTFMAVFFMAGVPLRWMAALMGMAVVGFGAIYLTVGHVRDRFAMFLGGGEANDNFQLARAHEAIAAGGLVGRGVGEGVMKRHVPDLHTDFIYSVAAEEFGLVFSIILIGVFGLVAIRGLRRARELADPFEQTAAGGLFVLLGLQAAINIAVNLGLVPTKGMTLPFISYGGSSMLGMCLTLGLALALTRKRPGAYQPGSTPKGILG